ncbi:MAG: N-acetylmuramoyl-L-alanine amidase [Lachnospiraceae bacterium]|nr:N-acetylmuramoyl-L-alanine amidase [Lachnospiraceae bacterium]
MKKRIFLFLLIFTFFAFFMTPVTIRADEPVIVVIDPGHGGENLGARYNGYIEKEMNLTVAQAMYDELSQYDGIQVYMTRESDAELTLAERAEYAAGVNADLLISLHFNASESHTFYGSEVWISAFGENYQEGYAFGEAVLDQFDTLGTYRKGVKTRLGDDGEDYYGIIREARARNVTAAIIEHCYMDHDFDKSFYNTTEKLKHLGRLDATATARYFGLSSESLGVDYSDYKKVMVELPSSAVKPDLTPPDICYLELEESDKDNRTLKLRLSAEDYDSGMLYYSYSLDGGETFATLREWPDADTFQFIVEVPNGISPHVVINAYNKYDVYATSNAITIEGFPLVSKTEQESAVVTESESEATITETTEEESTIEVWEEVIITTENSTEPDRSFTTFLIICGICLGSLFILLIIGYSYLSHQKKKRRRKF